MKKRPPYIGRTYLCAWHSDRIIKAGYTSNPRRYRAFEIRGAQVVAVATPKHPVDLEVELEVLLGQMSERAFLYKWEAISYLGGDGAGYMECHRFADQAAYFDALAACVRMMRPHLPEPVLAVAPTGICTDGRTDELTKNPTHLNLHRPVSNARDSGQER